MEQSYIGTFTFIERLDGSNSNNGEYFIVQQTPHTLYGVKIGAGYGAHELHKFALVGKEAYKVVSFYKDDAAARIGLVDMKHFAEAPLRKEKLTWVESLYAQTASNVRLVERALGDKKENKQTLCTIVTDGKQVWIESVSA